MGYLWMFLGGFGVRFGGGLGCCFGVAGWAGVVAPALSVC